MLLNLDKKRVLKPAAILSTTYILWCCSGWYLIDNRFSECLIVWLCYGIPLLIKTDALPIMEISFKDKDDKNNLLLLNVKNYIVTFIARYSLLIGFILVFTTSYMMRVKHLIGFNVERPISDALLMSGMVMAIDNTTYWLIIYSPIGYLGIMFLTFCRGGLKVNNLINCIQRERYKMVIMRALYVFFLVGAITQACKALETIENRSIRLSAEGFLVTGFVSQSWYYEKVKEMDTKESKKGNSF